MATFNIKLDKRTKLKNDKYNLVVLIKMGNDTFYLNIAKLTEPQYEQVFIKKSNDEKSIEFRETCNKYIPKCERIFNDLKPFDKPRFRELFYAKDKETTQSLLLTDMFDLYYTKKVDMKVKTKAHLRSTINVLETFHTGNSIWDITPDFLKRFERNKLGAGCSLATVHSNLRDLRMIINYFTNEEKIIPNHYIYPFAKGGYSISTFFPNKLVLKENEIKYLIKFKKFEDSDQEFALNIWLFLYRCNGINFADLLRMRWDNIQGDFIFFTRKKTETTRKNNIKKITVPIDPKLQELINKVGKKDSPYILGMLREGYTESTFENKNHKVKQQINKNLKKIAQQLKLSVPLNLSKARDCYATTLNRAGVSRDDIGEMLGHSNSVVTEHYLASMEAEKTFKINAVLL